jgi:oxygen-independent coproporphyrinogen-3 oxidase
MKSAVDRAEYVEVVGEEIKLASRILDVKRQRVGAIYFGGGTPSLLAPVRLKGGENGLEHLMNAIRTEFDVPDGCEVSCECTPFVNEPIDFHALSDAGVTRISIGVQSFDDELVKALNRHYRAEDSLRALRDSTLCGFRRVNVDLLYGLPCSHGQWLPRWLHSLEQICEMMPEGVTLYQLRVKKGTDYAKRDESHFPPLDVTLQMAAIARTVLSKVGYAEVAPDFFLLEEVADAAGTRKEMGRGGFFEYQLQKAQSRRFLGFGPSAYSFFNGALGYNESTLDKYMRTVKAGCLPISHIHTLTDDDSWRRFAIVALRYGSGISMHTCEALFDKATRERVKGVTAGVVTQGLMEFVDGGCGEKDLLQFTDHGRLCVDEICTLFYSDEVKKKLVAINRQYGAYATPGRGE